MRAAPTDEGPSYAGASHGWVNTRDKGALAALFAEVRLGDTVVVHRS